MEVRGSVILVENLVPALVELNASAAEDWPEEIDLEDMRTQTPKVKEAVTPCLDV
jgi:beta-glucanase (GH16 family)